LISERRSDLCEPGVAGRRGRQRGRRHPAAADRRAAWHAYRLERVPGRLRLGELCDRDGSFIVFAATEAERERAGDSRPSLQTRYPSREDYVAEGRAAASALVQQRLLLPEDAARYVDAATREPALA
jgi:Alpha/beta hydrolase domain